MTFTRDNLGRTAQIVSTYDAGRPAGQMIQPKRVTQSFNSLGQRTSIARFESASTANPVATSSFTYDTANRRLALRTRRARPTSIPTRTHTTHCRDWRVSRQRWTDFPRSPTTSDRNWSVAVFMVVEITPERARKAGRALPKVPWEETR
ncbi:MAG: hypothetical protein R3C53_01660 [Pirellulaceae bacterium]